MNQSIGCAPMPFALVNEKAVAENATLLPGSKAEGIESEASFSDVLESEIEDDPKPNKEPSQVEAWTVYGISSITVQLPPAKILSIPTVESVEGVLQGSDDSAVLDQGDHPAERPSSKGEAAPAAVERTEAAVKMRLETLKLAEQKVPLPLEADLTGREQIAENALKPAKIAHGMVAAQGALMVSESPKQEETALEQKLALSNDLSTETHSEERAAFKPVASAKELPKIQIDLADIAPVESFKTEWSSFEGISESFEAQPVKATEAIEIAQAIRNHVQVLKGGSQEMLDVVLRPDGQTELRLHVEKVNGQILVQARCDRGDFARLEANWTSVQQSLANQGVRVESLAHGTFSQTPDNSQNPSRNFDQRSAAEQQRA